MSAGAYRYGPWAGGPDPLASPYDVTAALDALGDAVLEGASLREALSALLRQGPAGRRGLDDLLRRVRQRQREIRRRGSLDGTLEQVRELLDRALGQERAALFPDPDDAARLAEAELDALPNDPARAVRALADYQWRSPAARQTYEQIRDLLRREVLDSQFRGMKSALADPSPVDLQRVKDMLADLNVMLDADARGEHTDADFAEFMAKHGQFFPDNPTNLEELVDSLARRAAAAERLMASLSDAQREELANLLAAAREDLGLAAELDRLGRALRERRPGLDWTGRERMRGPDSLGVGDATTALEELADLSGLESALRQDYPGASLDDVDPEAVQRALGGAAVDDLDALRRLERELAEQGFLTRSGGRLELTPRAVRRIGATALRRVFAKLDARGRGGHDVADAGAAGELTGAARAWAFGDEQPLDVVRTVRNAVAHSAPGAGGVRLRVEDFEVVETERRTSAAVCLLVDLSYSMALRGTWGTAKSTALALHSLVSTRFPQDSVEIVGFSDYARVLAPAELAGLSWDMVQGTNLQHGLMLAGRHLSAHPDAEPVVLVVTDGEPTAHLGRGGRAEFCWPPLPETVTTTMAEVEKLTRRGATINVFMLDDEPRLVRFVERLAQRNGGRVFSPAPDRLGEYVVRDYLRARRGRADADGGGGCDGRGCPAALRGLPREVGVLVAVAFAVAVGFGVVAPAIPGFARSFGVGRTAAGAVISAFAFMRLVSALGGGRLVDRFGERLVLASGIGIVAGSSALAGLAPNYLSLLLLRGVGGVGSAMFTVSAVSLLLRVARPDQRGQASGLFAGGFLLGGVAGPAFGGVVTSYSIRAPFFLYAGTLAVAGGIGLYALRHTPLADKAGAEGGPQRMRLLDALRRPAYRAALAANFADSWAVLGVRSALIPLFVVDVLGVGIVWVGVGFVVVAATNAMVLLPAGRLADTRGRRPVLLAGCLTSAAGVLLLAVLPTLPGYLAAMVVFGVGSGMLNVAPAAVVGDVVTGRGGTVVAAYQMSGDAGQVVGPLVAGRLADSLSYGAAFGATAGVLGLAGMLAYTAPETRVASVEESAATAKVAP